MTLMLRPLRADAKDDRAFVAALADAGLPTGDLEGGARFFAAVDADGRILGFGGLEGDGPDQMIRSVVIPAPLRRRGYGRTVVETLAMQARADLALRLWLLTMSADRFFAGIGWALADRAGAPDNVRATRQFTRLCPSSAVLMCRHLL